MNEPLLLADEVAQMLRIPEEHVYRLARRGEISSVRLGRYVRFTASAVDNFVKSNIAGAK